MEGRVAEIYDTNFQNVICQSRSQIKRVKCNFWLQALPSLKALSHIDINSLTISNPDFPLPFLLIST